MNGDALARLLRARQEHFAEIALPYWHSDRNVAAARTLNRSVESLKMEYGIGTICFGSTLQYPAPSASTRGTWYFPEKMHDLFATTTKTSGIRFIFTGTA